MMHFIRKKPKEVMNKDESLDTRNKPSYDSFADSLKFSSVEEKNRSPLNAWKSPDTTNSEQDHEDSRTPLNQAIKMNKTSDTWRGLSDDEFVNDEERNSILIDSSWKSRAEKYTSRNSFIFRRGSSKSPNVSNSIFSTTQLFEYVFLCLIGSTETPNPLFSCTD